MITIILEIIMVQYNSSNKIVGEDKAIQIIKC